MGKRKFSELYTTHSFSTEHIAAHAGVLVDVLDRMLTGLPVLKEAAEKVLSTLSRVTGQEYTLDNVDVNLYMIAANQSEVARLMSLIEDEFTSAKQGLQGLAQGTAKHQFMTAKQENIANSMNDLTALIGDEATEQFFMNLDIEPEQQGNIQDNA